MNLEKIFVFAGTPFGPYFNCATNGALLVYSECKFTTKKHKKQENVLKLSAHQHKSFHMVIVTMVIINKIEV